MLIYFDLFYSFAGTAYILVGADLVTLLVTRGLDQGDGLAGFGFNLVYSRVVAATTALLVSLWGVRGKLCNTNRPLEADPSTPTTPEGPLGTISAIGTAG